MDKIEDEGKPLATDIKSAIPDIGDELGTTGKRLDAATKSVAELDASVSKATNVRQDKHSKLGPVILPVEGERIILCVGKQGAP